MRDAGKPTPMTPLESSHTTSRYTTGDPPQGGKSATHIGSDCIPVEEDYPRSAWDTSTDYGPRKAWNDLSRRGSAGVARRRQVRIR